MFLGGCAFGGVARVAVATLIDVRHAAGVPWNTLVVNTSGALGLGLLAGLAAPGAWLHGLTIPWWALGIGFLGSYTTVSTFSLQTLALLRNGQWRVALTNVALSIVLCLGAAALGVGLVRLLGTAP